MGVRKVPGASRSRRTVSADLSPVRSWGLDLHEPSTRERVVEQAVGFVPEGIAHVKARSDTNSGVMTGGFPLLR
jgi:hypothetical protein